MDSLEQRYGRIRDAVQQAILRNFPNPERKGCPGDGVVREIAARRELIEDDAWQHITHCSPCYATFLQYKDDFRRQRRRRGLFILAAAAALVVVGSSVGIYEANQHGGRIITPTEQTYEPAILDFRDTSPKRGAETATPRRGPWSLPNRRLDLTIYLPFGSEPENYEVRLSKTGQTLVTVQGKAQINQGNTLLRVRLDLSRYAPGSYSIGIRQPPWSWTEYPVSLK
jgi:hypothetical protein